jgi:biofilm PGA synthesis N-glycosyltransferase PgaC
MTATMHTDRADTDLLVLEDGEVSHGTDLDHYVRRTLAPDMADERPSRIGCVIPAYNEEDSIAAVLESLLAQTHVPDEIHVVINNTTDDTFYIAREYAGVHERTYRDRTMTCAVHVHDVGKLPERKVGALNIGYHLIADCDYLLGVDGDTVVAKDAVERLFDELHSDPRIGGVSAIYSIDYDSDERAMPQYLIAGQRQQFASFNMVNLLRGRNMAVLGGQCSLFSMPALTAVQREYRQLGPWVPDSEVEDSLLSLQLKRLGFATKISARARAYVGPMVTLRSLDAQQVKWSSGAIELMWPGQRGNTQGQPFHPNLRLRWMENWSMLLNLTVRVLLVLLVMASLSIDAFVFNPLWLIPPALSVLLNLRTALAMHDRSAKDILFALLFVPGEVYMWIRLGHFVRAWISFFAHRDRDNWAAQAAAERGRGGNAYLQPIIMAAVLLVTITLIWQNMPLMEKATALWFAWPVLIVLTVLQSTVMVFKLFRRHRGFTV